MQYLIFTLEVVTIILWLMFGQKSLLSAILGIIIIIIISQLLHHFMHAR